MKSWRKVFLILIIMATISAILASMFNGGFFGWLFFILAGICIFIFYFIPTLIANEKKHRNEGAIGLLNFFIGWTFIGWLICLIWAETSQEPIKVSNANSNSNNNKYEDLERLQKLKDNGTITEEEFQKEKGKLLE